MLRAATLLIALFVTCDAWAQNVAVQQPVLQDFSVETTVTVPDRGSVLLGGVRSGAASRTTYGFGPLRNTGRGYSFSGSSVTAHVTIHDFQAMDEALLATPGPAVPTVSRWDTALKKRFAADRAGTLSRPGDDQDLDKRLKFERLARAAESDRKMSLAQAYWRAAARHGSTAGAQKLAAK